TGRAGARRARNLYPKLAWSADCTWFETAWIRAHPPRGGAAKPRGLARDRPAAEKPPKKRVVGSTGFRGQSRSFRRFVCPRLHRRSKAVVVAVLDLDGPIGIGPKEKTDMCFRRMKMSRIKVVLLLVMSCAAFATVAQATHLAPFIDLQEKGLTLAGDGKGLMGWGGVPRTLTVNVQGPVRFALLYWAGRERPCVETPSGSG